MSHIQSLNCYPKLNQNDILLSEKRPKNPGKPGISILYMDIPLKPSENKETLCKKK